MAQQEHNRWWVERKLAGWTKGPRDDLRLMHPDMVPFDQLEEDTKEFDRETIRSMPMLLKQAYQLVIIKKQIDPTKSTTASTTVIHENSSSDPITPKPDSKKTT